MATKQTKKTSNTTQSGPMQCKRSGGWVWCGIFGAVLFTTGVLIGYNTNRGPQMVETVVVNPVGEKLPAETCAAIEELMLGWISSDEYVSDYNERLRRAEIYTRLSEKGCPANKEMYKKMALRELDIARALSDDFKYDDSRAVEVVEIYKELDMKAEARKFFDKMQRITDPAIDFILQVERILSE